MHDQCVHKGFWILRLRGHHFHARDQTIAKDEDFNPHLNLFPDRVVLDAYLLDLTEEHTPEVHRRSRFESAEGFVKHDSPGFDSRVREPHGLSPVTEEGEHRIRFGWGRHRYAGGVWNAIPPRIIAARDWVWTLNPLVSSDRSMPLACQNRVFVVTY